MIEGGTGGGNTITGLLYEASVELVDYLNQQKDYLVKGVEVYYKDKIVAYTFKKHGLYRFLKSQGVDWKKHLSKKLLPDNCIYVIVNNTLFILEVKTQNVAGSVDEKLQTCDFKRKQYKKLVASLQRICRDYRISHHRENRFPHQFPVSVRSQIPCATSDCQIRDQNSYACCHCLGK